MVFIKFKKINKRLKWLKSNHKKFKKVRNTTNDLNKTCNNLL